MKAPQFKKGLTVQPSKATGERVNYRLAVRAIRVTPKRRPLINQPLAPSKPSMAKVLVWAAIN